MSKDLISSSVGFMALLNYSSCQRVLLSHAQDHVDRGLARRASLAQPQWGPIVRWWLSDRNCVANSNVAGVASPSTRAATVPYLTGARARREHDPRQQRPAQRQCQTQYGQHGQKVLAERRVWLSLEPKWTQRNHSIYYYNGYGTLGLGALGGLYIYIYIDAYIYIHPIDVDARQ